LGMPRDNMPYNHTWPYLLYSMLQPAEVVSRVQRALTTQMLFGGSAKDYLEYYQPSIVLLQVGIVDCAPRYLSGKSMAVKLLAAAPGFIAGFTWKLIKKYGKRRPSRADVSLTDFEKNLENYAQRAMACGVQKLLCIKIATPGTAMALKNPGIGLQVKNYNAVIERLCTKYSFMSAVTVLDNADDTYFIEDGYHLSEKGNAILANAITSVLT
jgi:acyl-CoA thioesterase I